jgi:membrane protein implicated in regulation of membrane protease activity
MVLVAFVLVAAAVVWRRSYGIAQSRQIRLLDRDRTQLVALRAKLESDIRTFAGRGTLAPVAEQRLRMHVPHDSQVVIIQRSVRGSAPR